MRRLSLAQWLKQIHGSPLYMTRRIVGRLAYELRKSLVTGWSTAWLRARCAILGFKCASEIEVCGPVDLRGPPETIEIGRGVRLVSSSWRCSSTSIAQSVRLRTYSTGARIILGDGCGLNGTSITARTKMVRIGRNVLIGPDCMIVDSDFHDPWPPEGRESRPGFERDADVVIGENVWIGARSIILKGVVIGANALVGAGSVVISSVPPNSLVVGNPARVVKIYVEVPPKGVGVCASAAGIQDPTSTRGIAATGTLTFHERLYA